MRSRSGRREVASAAKLRDNALSRVRFDFRWRGQFNLSLDPAIMLFS